MTSFLGSWYEDSFLNVPFGPLGLIAMKGTEQMGEKINSWLMRWRYTQEKYKQEMIDNGLLGLEPGWERENFLIDVECPRFGNGEGKALIKQSVRGYDIYILCDVGAYNKSYTMYGQKVPMSPDDHFQDLKRIIAALGGKAKRITVLMPMLYEGRQHRRTSRESLDCAIALQELENMGVTNIITFDAHDSRVQNATPLTGFENFMPTYQILKALLRKEKDLLLDKEHMMIVSPDEGAIDRNIFYSSVVGLNMGIFYKRRDYTKIVNGRNPIIAHEYLGESVEGKDVFVADDIIASGDSMLDLAKELKKRKAKRIYAAATFALFTQGIEDFSRAYEEGIISGVVSTDLTYTRPELLEKPWFIRADMSKYMSYIIATLNHDRSLNKLLNPYDRIKNFISKYHQDQANSGIRFV